MCRASGPSFGDRALLDYIWGKCLRARSRLYFFRSKHMQRLALLPNSSSLAESFLTPIDSAKVVFRKAEGEDGWRGDDDDERVGGSAVQGAVGFCLDTADEARATGSSRGSHYLCEPCPRRGVHRGQGAYKRHRRDRCTRRCQRTLVALEDGLRAAAADRRLDAILTRSRGQRRM